MWQGINFRQNQLQGVRMNKIKERFAQIFRPIQKKYDKFVEIGSYPFFRLGKIGVSVVSRSTSKSKLIQVNKDLMKAIKTKKIKILNI